MCISGFFNIIAVNDSKKSNYTKCEAKENDMKRFQDGKLQCDYRWYYATAILSLLTSVSLVFCIVN